MRIGRSIFLEFHFQIYFTYMATFVKISNRFIFYCQRLLILGTLIPQALYDFLTSCITKSFMEQKLIKETINKWFAVNLGQINSRGYNNHARCPDRFL